MIVSLSDHNQQELREIQLQKEELIRDFEEKKAGRHAALAVITRGWVLTPHNCGLVVS